jgi:Transglycosylase SLT domain/Putative peptidoglycan binding domain
MRPRRFIVLAALVAALGVPASAGAVTDVQVAGLQAALRAKGFYAGSVDAVSGPLTRRGVLRFQRRSGLVVDGVVGPQTRAALGRLGRPLYGTRLMRRRMVGWDVSVLQFLLMRNGASAGAIDGHFGPLTDGAVRRFQRRAGIAVDGVAGPQTRSALGAAAPRSIRSRLNHWAGHYGVDARLVRALAWMESGHQPQVVSSVGARGVMQVMPGTRRYVETVLLGERVPRTIDGNIRVGVAFLHQQLHAFRFNVRRALAAYYQGPSAVRRHGLFPETRRFVRTVLAIRRRV